MQSFYAMAGMIGRGRLEAVTMELGRDAARITAGVYADGRVGLALGSGEEFVGGCLDLPVRVGAASREVLDVSAGLLWRLGRLGPDHEQGPGCVLFSVHTSRAVYGAESRLGRLERGRSYLAPLWRAFSRLMSPMIVTLFDARGGAARPRRDVPGLVRARRLWTALAAAPVPASRSRSGARIRPIERGSPPRERAGPCGTSSSHRRW